MENSMLLSSANDVATTELLSYFCDGMRPPPDFTISEWADKYRSLPRVGSSEPGLWRTDRTPYLREIMNEMSPSSHTEDVVLIKGSQLGCTEALINIALYYMAHAPCPILIVQPTITVGERFSKQRLQPSISECEQLRDKVEDTKSRSGGNTTLQKDFPGGTLIIGGANSASGLRSMPIQVALLDEIDGYPFDVDGEGDPVELVNRRTTNFPRRKRFYGSTPTMSEMSRVADLFRRSDQRYFFVPCPYCSEMQVIKWENIKFTNHDPTTAHLICEACGQAIYEHHKTRMLGSGEWRKSNPASAIAGFHISALYSPIGWYSWANAVEDHLKAIGDPLKRKVWVNTVLGETWDDQAVTIDAHWLAKRKERYGVDVPAQAMVLTSGVDTQDDRLEAFIYGWGAKQESWLIDYSVFRGDPSKEDVWHQLDLYLMQQWTHASGRTMLPAVTCIDAMGHHTESVYRFCSSRVFRRVYPVQGYSRPGSPIVSVSQRKFRYGLSLYRVGSDQAKEVIYNRLKITEPGPGYVHFPDSLKPGFDGLPRELPDTYFSGLTSERRIKVHVGGLPRLRWVLPPNKRNEPLDGFVYALAGLHILSPNQELRQVIESKFNRPAKLGRRLISRGVRV